MASVLRLRLIEAAELIANEYPHAVELKIEPTGIRIIATKGFFTTHRIASWEEAENSEINTLTVAIHSAIRQLRKKKGRDYDTSMGL